MSLQSFKEKLDNLEGEYTFNFANDDDSEYFFEEFGGEERLKIKFPEVYKSYLKTRQSSLNRMASDSKSEEVCTSLKVDYLDIEVADYLPKDSVIGETKGISVKQINVPVSCQFIDETTEVKSLSPAKEWTNLIVQTQIRDVMKPNYLLNTNFFVSSSNHALKSQPSEPIPAEALEGQRLKADVTITGTDPKGILRRKVTAGSKNILSSELRAIFDMTIEDPAPKTTEHKQSQEIMMLYNRIDEQEIYKHADYKDGDYYKNAYASGQVRLLMPMKGTVELNYGVRPEGLKKVDSAVFFTRSTSTYGYKGKVFTHYGEETNAEYKVSDTEFYNKIKGCFTDTGYNTEKRSLISFDIKIPDTTGAGRSDYDWHNDVSGESGGAKQTFFLTGAFEYEINYLDEKGSVLAIGHEQITIKSITKADLKAIQRQYYQYKLGSSTIYIPPIDIYWGCFGKDVHIMLADKTEKCASEVKVGEKLLGYDNKVLTVDNIVTGVDATIYLIKTKDNSEIKVSGGHPMMCEGECVRACQIKIGDKLNLLDGSLAEVESIEVIEYNDTVYNFTFEGVEEGVYIVANGFYSGDLRMQNKKDEHPERIFTTDEKLLMAEMMLHNEELKLKNML